MHIGRRQSTARAEPLSMEAARQEFKDYVRRNPLALKALARVLNYPWDGSEAGCLALAQQLPMVWLRRVD